MQNLSLGLDYIFIKLNIMKLFAFVDALFANNQNLSSQIGYIIVLGNEKNTEETFIIFGNFAHWFSVKCKRITRSVFASEIYAIAYGVNIAVAIGTIVDKITDRLRLPKAFVVICIDFLFLYKCFVKLGTIKKKRLMIDIMALRQTYERQKMFDVRWIDGNDNPANVITKAGPNRALEQLVTTNKLTLKIQEWIKRERKTDGG
jgi:hypothetical protein